MTLSEFKAWFEGFTESMEGAPTEAQFKRIKDRVAEINGVAVTERVYVDRYRPDPYFWQHTWFNGQPLVARGVGIGMAVGNVAQSNSFAQSASNLKSLDAQFDSHTAMYAVGKAEALGDAT